MMNIRFKYKVALSSIVILMVFVTLTSFSYAYFTTVVEGTGNDISATTAEVTMNFTEGNNSIDLPNAYTFDLTNNNEFPVDVYVFLSVLNDSNQELIPHIKVAYDNEGTGYTSKLLDVNGNDNSKWSKMVDLIYPNATSYLLDTINLSTGGSKTGIKLLLWIEETTGGVVDCKTDETGNTICTLPDGTTSNQTPEECTTSADGKTVCTPKSDTMNQTFKARISIRAIPKRDPVNMSSGEPIETGE